MSGKLFFLSLLFAIFLFLAIQWGKIPAGIHALESLIRPVLHKEIINRYAGIYKEDPLFVMAIIKVESRFFKEARSRRGALGLMQIMPRTAKEIAKELKIKNLQEHELKNPEINIQFGFHYLKKLRTEFGEDDLTVLAAYNAGSKNVKNWLAKNKKKRLSYEEIEFTETKNFTKEVLSTYLWLKRIQGWRNKILKTFQ